MVLMRRKDKRRGNEAEEISVASDSSIVATKGLRSLQSARTGRFAADMRVQVGGYGRADKTWGVDHPWHKTREEIVDDISARDHLEEGTRVKEEERPQGQGLSRAALKKKKMKMKKGGLTESTAGSEMGSEAPTSVVAEKTPQEKESKKKQKTKAAKQTPPASQQDDGNEDKPAATASSIDANEGDESKNKKRKRVNRNKKKQQKARAGADDDSDDESELDESVEIVAKAKKQKAAATDTQPTEVVASTEKDKNFNKADAAKREAIAKQYEVALGQEFVTASGLTIRDLRHGEGRVPLIGEMITVRYRGRIDDQNGIVFGKGMLSTTYGTGSVIAGWEEGMGTMRTGGSRHLTVPPSLAYGSVAKGPKIPANATLFFEVELVRVGKRKREVVTRDDIPLPSSFQRKKLPSAATAKDNKNAANKKSKSKGRRRKFSI